MSLRVIDHLQIVYIKHNDSKFHIRTGIDLRLEILFFIFESHAVIYMSQRISSHQIKKTLIDVIQSKRMTELFECQTHAGIVCMKKVIHQLFDTVSEDQVSISRVFIMKRKTDIKMIRS